ncbi:hypothetical protein AXF42_Ash013097 [Apostasia shenzhenica]|uniref:Uncharacterized protein n=1 Tax=Apostasia shenzhenica TaxID=1088818 RepID=A0A2I0BD12_9ASPA|nr:hypothetical protein AXF42_Ash013097 [Apostasia shenzhenica]
MFSGASSAHLDWRDYYFFVGGDLKIPLKPGVCPPEFIGDARWMAGEGTLRNLERLKGQNWPLKNFLRHVKNDISLGPGGDNPQPLSSARKLLRQRRVKEAEVPEPVGGGTAVDVVSSSDDTTEDRKTLAEILKGAEGQRKEDKGQEGAHEKEGEGAAVSPCLDPMPKEVPKRKRDPLEERSPEPPSKTGKIELQGSA